MLDQRLQAISNLVIDAQVLVDVGSDHGYLCIDLVQQGKVKHAYALDVNEGPLANAKANVKRYHQTKNIKCLKSNGLTSVAHLNFDHVVIAGLGGSVIVEILQNNINNLQGATIIVQPNINSYALRLFLLSNHYNIIAEEVIFEGNRYYEIIKAIPGASEQYTYLELLFGKINLSKRNEILTVIKEQLLKEQLLLTKIPKTDPKYQEFTLRITLMEEYLNET
ncbi:MAG: tRNA (adenine(22)-N(1))-methyltransferase [Bacilli bacterium]